MQFRPAQQQDIAAIFAIEQAVFGSAVYPDFFFRQAYDLWPSLLLVAVAGDGTLAGYALGAPANEAGIGWVMSLAVAASQRGQGIGRGLTQALCRQMQAQGVQQLRLTVDPGNHTAVALYRQLGFVLIAQEAEYFGAGEPRLVLQCALADAAC